LDVCYCIHPGASGKSSCRLPLELHAD
jgi:hypothetical protein